MTEFSNYSLLSSADPRGYSPEVATWFNSKEEELGLKIVVEFCNFNQKIRDIPFQEEADGNVLRIFDLGSPVATRRDRGEVVTFLTPEEMESAFNEATGAWDNDFLASHAKNLYLGQRSIVANLDATLHQALCYKNIPYLNTDLGTIWVQHGLGNWVRSEIGITESLEKMFGYWFTKVIDPDFSSGIEEKRKVRVHNAIMKSVGEASRQRIDKMQLGIQEREARIAEHSDEMTRLSAEIKMRMRDLGFAQKMRVQDDSEVENNIKEIYRNDKLERVDFDPNMSTLDLYTKTMYLYAPGNQERTVLGKCKISYSVTGRTITITNLTNKKGGRQHPHVPDTGKPCWGEMEVVMRNYLRDAELIPMVEMLLNYLEQVTPTDEWGAWASFWWDTQEKEVLQEDGSWKTETGEMQGEETVDPSLVEALDDIVDNVEEEEIA